VTEPEAIEGTFHGAGDRQIYWRSWPPPEEPRAIVVIAHGFGEHSGRYEELGERLRAEGYAVYTLDHHGHGRSAGARGRVSIAAAVADLDQLVQLAQTRHPEADVFLLGHSMGAAIAIRYTIAHGARLAGLILSGPLAEVDGRAVTKALARIVGAIVPALPVAKLDANTVSRDRAVVAAYKFDPLVFDTVPAGTAVEFIRHADTLPDDVRSVTLPTLVMYGTEDRLCAPAGAEMIARRIGSDDITATPYTGLYHEIFNEPEREQVIDELLGWLAAHVPAPTPEESRLGN
jgi:alpha-beta hydrolase superfamily lysophospholipase